MQLIVIGAGIVALNYCAASLGILDAHILWDKPTAEAYAPLMSDMVLRPATDNGKIGTFYSVYYTPLSVVQYLLDRRII